MTEKEFIAGLPFKMKTTMDIQPVYSYADVKGHQCIQKYSIASPNPVYHCDVLKVYNGLVHLKTDLLGRDAAICVRLEDMHLVGDSIPIKTYTHNCFQSAIYESDGGYTVKVVDLYDGIKLLHLTETHTRLSDADHYAKTIVSLK